MEAVVSPLMMCGHCMEGLPFMGSLNLALKRVRIKALCTLRVCVCVCESHNDTSVIAATLTPL